MFTVLICDKHLINDCNNKYYIYLKPFLDDAGFSFCAWNTEGPSLDEAVPELKNLIRGKKEWRAIIVNDNTTWDFDSVNKINPFDYVDSVDRNDKFDSLETIREFRARAEGMADKAMKNPLTRLSIWLCGSPVRTRPDICYAGEEELVEDLSGGSAYFNRLSALGLSAREVEEDRVRTYRYKNLSAEFDLGGELFDAPQSVIAIAERAKDVSRELADMAWVEHTEFDYSRFYIENMYPDRLRYLIYDMPYVKGVQNENIYFNFLTVLLVLATHEVPGGVLRSNRVYNVNVEIDSDYVRELCNRYNAKLKATIGKIDEISRKITDKSKEPVDTAVAESLFEAKVTVPVEIESKVNTYGLMARHDGIGLAGDCPSSEYGYWNEQYRTISTLFNRYLKEPRRAIRTAAKKGFRSRSEISDERVLQLDEFQIESIVNNLASEELSMVTTSTKQLGDSEKYKERIEEADKNLRRAIRQRMTKRRTIYVGLIAMLAYFLGFLPLFFGNLNTNGSFAFSLGITAAALALFASAGFIGLFVLRRRLIGDFEAFNETMEGVLAEINGELQAYSEYLSHACNVMRCFSVINYSRTAYERKQNILNNHRRMINEKLAEVNELFSKYIDQDSEEEESLTVQPYDYDFTLLKSYNYEMPYSEVEKRVEFMQPGNMITVPVDYLKSISVTREELYD